MSSSRYTCSNSSIFSISINSSNNSNSNSNNINSSNSSMLSTTNITSSVPSYSSTSSTSSTSSFRKQAGSTVYPLLMEPFLWSAMSRVLRVCKPINLILVSCTLLISPSWGSNSYLSLGLIYSYHFRIHDNPSHISLCYQSPMACKEILAVAHTIAGPLSVSGIGAVYCKITFRFTFYSKLQTKRIFHFLRIICCSFCSFCFIQGKSSM